MSHRYLIFYSSVPELWMDFDGFLHHSVLFMVFSVFTSIMNFFLLIPLKPSLL